MIGVWSMILVFQMSVRENIYKRLKADIEKLRQEYITRIVPASKRVEAMKLLDEVERLTDELYKVSSPPAPPTPPGPPAPPPGQSVIGPVDFQELLGTLDKMSFADDKLNVLETAAKKYYFTIDQLCEILDKFSMDDDKLEAVKLVYPRVVDKENAYKLYDKFTFSSTKEELKKYLNSQE